MAVHQARQFVRGFGANSHSDAGGEFGGKLRDRGNREGRLPRTGIVN